MDRAAASTDTQAGRLYATGDFFSVQVSSTTLPYLPAGSGFSSLVLDSRRNQTSPLS